MNGAQAIEVSERTFGGESSETLMRQAVMAYMAGNRQGSRAQKTRSEVSGGGKRPWRQKGTDHVRVGTIRSSIWRGGGTTSAAKPRSHEQKLNKKIYRAALCSILAGLVRLDRLAVVADLAVDTPKTKGLITKLDTLDLKGVLVMTDGVGKSPYLAARSLAHVNIRDVQGSDPVSLIAYDKVLVTVSVVKKFEEPLR